MTIHGKCAFHHQSARRVLTSSPGYWSITPVPALRSWQGLHPSSPCPVVTHWGWWRWVGCKEHTGELLPPCDLGDVLYTWNHRITPCRKEAFAGRVHLLLSKTIKNQDNPRRTSPAIFLLRHTFSPSSKLSHKSLKVTGCCNPDKHTPDLLSKIRPRNSASICFW